MLANFFANILFPPVCLVCRGRIPDGTICDACLNGIEIRESLLCGECHAAIKVGASVASGSAGVVLASSTCHPDFPYLLGGAGDYSNFALQSLIHNLKFRGMRGAAKPLGELLYKYTLAMGIDPDDRIILPIPLSPRRKRMRGYNQAELIARSFAQRADLARDAVDTGALVRAKHAKPQSDIQSPDARRENIRGAFMVRDEAAHSIIAGKNILLIDDVATTGSTFLEASLALKSAGAGRIIALAVAKT